MSAVVRTNFFPFSSVLQRFAKIHPIVALVRSTTCWNIAIIHGGDFTPIKIMVPFAIPYLISIGEVV